MSPILERAFRALRAWPQGGGLEISDTALRFAERSGKSWRTASARLPPGLMQGGRIVDRARCIEAFSSFRAEITGNPSPKATVAAAVVLSSARVYTHAFTLPRLEGADLAAAADLNLQMASPFDAGADYRGWQEVGAPPAPGDLRRDIMGAFIDRTIADDLLSALTAAGFVPRSLESRALSLARVARERGTGVPRDTSSLLLHIDESGFEFLLLEAGTLAFQYFTPWSDLAGEAKEVPWESFASQFKKDLRQVLNYVVSRRKEPVTELFLAASALAEGTTALLAEEGGIAAHPLTLAGDAAGLGPEWFVAAGGGLRGAMPPREDKDVSLLGVTAREEFWRYQIIRFLRFWRILFPATLLVFLGVGMTADIFLVRERRAVEEEARTTLRADRASAITALENAANDFNRIVESVLRAAGSREPKSAAIADLQGLLAGRSVTADRITIEENRAVTLAAHARSEADIRGLAEDLRATGRFADVNVPFAGIRPDGEGFSFSLSAVRISPSASSSPAR